MQLLAWFRSKQEKSSSAQRQTLLVELTFTGVVTVLCGGSPGLRHESRAAVFTTCAARIVDALALQHLRFVRIREVARLCVSVAHTPPTDRDVLDTVEVLQRNGETNVAL